MPSTKSLLTTFIGLIPIISATSLPSETIAQSKLGSWFENIAVRANGDLLLTEMLPSANILTVVDPSSGHTSAEKIATIPSIQGLFGIAEYRTQPDTFVVVGGNATGIGQPVQGTFSAWKLSFRRSKCGEKASIEKIADLGKDRQFLNGVTTIPGVADAVLVADSAAGRIIRLDLVTGAVEGDAFAFEELAPVPSAKFQIGVNGIHIRDGYLYWTNSATLAIYRVKITPEGRAVSGAKPEVIVDVTGSVDLLDDFDFDSEGNIYVASNLNNSVIYVDVKTGKFETVVGGDHSLILPGSTSAIFGRGKKDKKTLYVTTSGALAAPVDGDKTEGAKVVAVDTRRN